MRHLDKFGIVIDSNEFTHGNTWTFPGVSISTQSLLKYGCDYAVKGQVGIIGVERKSYSDYVRCIGGDWIRFQKQLAKLQKNRIYCLIVEASIDSPIYHKSRMRHENVIAMTGIVGALGGPVIFAGSRTKATVLCQHFMAAALKRIQDGS